MELENVTHAHIDKLSIVITSHAHDACAPSVNNTLPSTSHRVSIPVIGLVRHNNEHIHVHISFSLVGCKQLCVYKYSSINNIKLINPRLVHIKGYSSLSVGLSSHFCPQSSFK